LSIRVVIAPWRELPGRLRDRQVDVVVGSLSEIEQLDEFEILALSAHDTVVVGRPGHPLTVAGHATLGDIFRYPLAGPGLDADAAELLSGLATAVTGAPASPSGGALLTIECDSSDVLTRVLMESDALSIMPRFIVADDLACERLAIVTGVEPGLRVQFGAAWLRARTLSTVGTAFLETMRADDHPGSRAG
jgi:DNA-binding transcriptional LysR family regulator